MKPQDLPSHMLRSQIRDSLSQVHRDYEQQLYLEMDSDPNPVGFRRNREKAMLQCITLGDLERMETYLIPAVQSMDQFSGGMLSSIWEDFVVGTLSERPFEQMLYLFISQITLCTRAAMDGGLPERQAYALSDSYIRYGTQLTDIHRLGFLMSYAPYDFAQAVSAHRFRNMSQITRLCCEYIQRHLHDRITLEDLSGVCHRSSHYISDLFARETGERPMRYIRRRKLEYAKGILAFTDISVEAVSDLLAFPGTSSFITYFKQEYGVTPMQYRKS